MSQLGGDLSKARIAATAMLMLPGMPFVYYGEEIGMRGAKPDEQIRTPMQWSAAAGAGFTTGKPWEDPQPDWQTVNVAAQDADTGSLLTLYRTLVHLRLAHPALSSGNLALMQTNDSSTAAFARRAESETVLVALNFSDRPIARLDAALDPTLCARHACRLEPLLGDAQASVRETVPGIWTLSVQGIGPRQALIVRLLR